MTRRRILLIEDDRGCRIALCALLEDAGYEVSCAGSGAEARLMFKRIQPDLIITECSLPDMTADEVTRLSCGAPVVVVTGAMHMSDSVDGPTFEHPASRLDDVGVLAWIDKPVVPEELLDLVADRIGETSKPERQVARSAS